MLSSKGKVKNCDVILFFEQAIILLQQKLHLNYNHCLLIFAYILIFKKAIGSLDRAAWLYWCERQRSITGTGGISIQIRGFFLTSDAPRFENKTLKLENHF